MIKKVVIITVVFAALVTVLLVLLNTVNTFLLAEQERLTSYLQEQHVRTHSVYIPLLGRFDPEPLSLGVETPSTNPPRIVTIPALYKAFSNVMSLRRQARRPVVHKPTYLKRVSVVLKKLLSTKVQHVSVVVAAAHEDFAALAKRAEVYPPAAGWTVRGVGSVNLCVYWMIRYFIYLVRALTVLRVVAGPFLMSVRSIILRFVSQIRVLNGLRVVAGPFLMSVCSIILRFVFQIRVLNGLRVVAGPFLMSVRSIILRFVSQIRGLNGLRVVAGHFLMSVCSIILRFVFQIRALNGLRVVAGPFLMSVCSNIRSRMLRVWPPQNASRVVARMVWCGDWIIHYIRSKLRYTTLTVPTFIGEMSSSVDSIIRCCRHRVCAQPQEETEVVAVPRVIRGKRALMKARAAAEVIAEQQAMDKAAEEANAKAAAAKFKPKGKSKAAKAKDKPVCDSNRKALAKSKGKSKKNKGNRG